MSSKFTDRHLTTAMDLKKTVTIFSSSDLFPRKIFFLKKGGNPGLYLLIFVFSTWHNSNINFIKAEMVWLGLEPAVYLEGTDKSSELWLHPVRKKLTLIFFNRNSFSADEDECWNRLSIFKVEYLWSSRLDCSTIELFLKKMTKLKKMFPNLVWKLFFCANVWKSFMWLIL